MWFNSQIRFSKKLNKFLKKFKKAMLKSERDDFQEHHYETIITHFLSFFFSQFSYHDAIISLTKSNHSLNSIIMVRPQLESLLILYEITKENTNLEIVEEKFDEYWDWVMIKLYQNSKKSKVFTNRIKSLKQNQYNEEIENNYNYVKDKYINNPQKFESMQSSTSFLKNKYEIAKELKIEDLYHHVYSESSASIHVTDLADRIEHHDEKKVFHIKHKRNFSYPLFLSNLLIITLISITNDFFKINKEVTKYLSRLQRMNKDTST